MTGSIKKTAVFPFALILFIAVYLSVFAAILCAIALFSLGLLSAAVSIGSLFGFITVATDLSPPAMLFAGVSCVFSSLAISAALYIVMPKTMRLFYRIWEWFRLSLKNERV